VHLIREPLVFDFEGFSSAAHTLKLAIVKALKRKIKSTFFLKS
jgi:hypothetical protein